MCVKLKLSRHGRKNKPVYSLVAAESRFSRDGRFIKKLGSYDPHRNDGAPKLTITDQDALKKYLSCGAQPTETVGRLLKARDL